MHVASKPYIEKSIPARFYEQFIRVVKLFNCQFPSEKN